MFTTECPNSGRARRSLLALIAVAGLLFAGACSNPEKAKLEHVQSGETYLKEEKFQEASIEFRNAIQLDDRLAAAHWGLAQAYEGLGSFQQVYAELRRTTPAGGGAPFEANRYIIQNGDARQLLIYWYQGRGRMVASEYWGKIYTVMDSVSRRRSDGAMVRVIVPFVGSEDEALQRGTELAALAAPQLPGFIPN